jgi:hypothetical protein
MFRNERMADDVDAAGAAVGEADIDQLGGLLNGAPDARETVDRLPADEKAAVHEIVADVAAYAFGEAMLFAAGIAAAILPVVWVLLRRSRAQPAEPD